MSVRRLCGVSVLLFLVPLAHVLRFVAAAAVAVADDDTASTCPARRSQSTCSLYLAPSTIPGAGVGIFTSKALSQGDTVGFGDLMTPLIDLYWHHNKEYMKVGHPYFDYVWEGGKGRQALESSDLQAGSVLLMGFGLEAAINCHLALVNADSPKVIYDDYHASLLHRSRDPGAGAFTPYLSGVTRMEYPVPKNGELFKFYSDNWFVQRAKEFGLVPLSNDYVMADGLIEKFASIFPEARNPLTLQGMHTDLWDLMANFPYESRVTNAIPKYHDQISLAITDRIWEPYVQEARITTEELRQKGRCLDNISHGPSSIKQAGRGAFATTALKAGSVITGSPMLHTQNDSLFQMYESVHSELTTGEYLEGDLIDRKAIRTYQTALNYCWKHPQSTMLLCPYGSGVNFINHNATLANVNVQWAPDGQIGHNSSFLGLGFDNIFQTSKARLSFDYVALRDIQEGDELFLDYGSHWERAWQEHAGSFKPSSPEDYQSAHDINLDGENSVVLTEEEQRLESYPSNVELRCHILVESSSMYVMPAEIRLYSWTSRDIGLPCQVLSRSKETAIGTIVYDVVIYSEHDASNGSCSRVKGVTRTGLQFFDRPYTTDIHLPETFRQPIGIPDQLFPAAWKNQLISPAT